MRSVWWCLPINTITHKIYTIINFSAVRFSLWFLSESSFACASIMSRCQIITIKVIKTVISGHQYLQLILQFHCFPLEGQLLLQTRVQHHKLPAGMYRKWSSVVSQAFRFMFCWTCRGVKMQRVSRLTLNHTLQSDAHVNIQSTSVLPNVTDWSLTWRAENGNSIWNLTWSSTHHKRKTATSTHGLRQKCWDASLLTVIQKYKYHMHLYVFTYTEGVFLKETVKKQTYKSVQLQQGRSVHAALLTLPETHKDSFTNFTPVTTLNTQLFTWK